MPSLESDESKFMLISAASRHSFARYAIPAVLAFCMASMGSAAQDDQSQNVPLISGGVGFRDQYERGKHNLHPRDFSLARRTGRESHPG
jgi:hypothetical protein